ncbi:MAG TPA: ribosome recycling factor [Kiritimatiellia bacterium]|nr:ribosome recycling factor [Kiritimatiellia bacterium]
MERNKMYDSADDVLLEADDKMEKAVGHLQQGLAGLRTGKASPTLVEHISVECYGTQTRLNQMSLISTPEPRLIVIKPYDPSSLPAIEKAILAANIGVTPLNDGRIIRVPIPELSEERRKELTKVASRMGEEARVAVRAIRRDANEAIKALEKAGTISEDDRDQALAEVQKYTDTNSGKVDDLVAAKEKDILAV